MMSKPLSSFLNEALIRDLQAAVARGKFPGVTFELAMNFILTDGVLPASGLPVQSFLKLEDLVRSHASASATFTATQLKNETGSVLDAVRAGKTVRITQHGRPFAEMRRVD